MRQFFSWRIWAAVAALVGLVVMLKFVLPASATKPAVSTGVVDRHIDFVSLVYVVRPAPDFVIHDGVVIGTADFVIDGQRTMHIAEGTFGDISCDNYQEVGRCVVVADLLGDAVVWFSLVPVAPGLRINAPPIIALLDGGFVRLQNGWVAKLAASVDRSCSQQTGSLAEFVRRFGPASTTVIDLSKQRITIVKCSADVKASG